MHTNIKLEKNVWLLTMDFKFIKVPLKGDGHACKKEIVLHVQAVVNRKTPG